MLQNRFEKIFRPVMDSLIHKTTGRFTMPGSDKDCTWFTPMMKPITTMDEDFLLVAHEVLKEAAER